MRQQQTDNSLFVLVLSKSNKHLVGESPPDLMVLSCKWDSVSNIHFGLLKVVLHQDVRCVFWIVVLLEDKLMTKTQFCC